MHRHPSTALSRLADMLHRAYVRLFGDRGSDPAAAHHRSPGRPRMVLAGGIVKALRDDRALRAECERMAALLGGARRGRAECVTFRARMSRIKAAARVPARQRFAHAAQATRTAAREVAAVAASTARQLGARHRHVPGSTDVQHDFVRKLIKYGKTYERTRAAGERSTWAQGREIAW